MSQDFYSTAIATLLIVPVERDFTSAPIASTTGVAKSIPTPSALLDLFGKRFDNDARGRAPSAGLT